MGRKLDGLKKSAIRAAKTAVTPERLVWKAQDAHRQHLIKSGKLLSNRDDEK